MKLVGLLLFSFFILSNSFLEAQKVQAYQLYDSNGKKVSFEKMMKVMAEKEIILFGEFHNNPISHWMQLKLVQYLSTESKIALGAEMFETDNQEQLNLYLKGEIDAKALDTLARLWMNYKTDYKPLVDFAKEHRLDFLATNIPRRFASLVYKKGFGALDSLPDYEKAFIAPLPIRYDPELPGYKNMLTMMSDHANENFPKAQAIKDATMAHFIYEHFKEHQNKFIHFNGAYHSNNYEGIFWYLKQMNENLKIGTITTVSQENVHELATENKGLADFILVVDEDMTTTY